MTDDRQNLEGNPKFGQVEPSDVQMEKLIEMKRKQDDSCKNRIVIAMIRYC